MYKYTSLFALALFALSSCQNTGSNTAEPETTVVEQPQPVMNTENETVLSGENFEVKTVDATIKSPRKELTGEVASVPVTINYGSPAVNERTIFGDLVPYDKVWRTGANEATRITFKQPVIVGAEGKKLAAGTYALFTIPTDGDKWTVIFNKKSDQWGAYDYDSKDDVVQIKGQAMELGASAERMDFALEGDNVKLMWADLAVSFPVKSAAK